MQFQQIRGATVKLNFAGISFLIDPFFAPKDAYPPLEACHHPNLRWPTVELPLPMQEIVKDIDAVIITHLHPDHLDEFAIKALPKNLPILAQDETDAKVIRQFGFADVRVLSYDGTDFGQVKLTRIDCLHGHPETTQKYYDMMNLRGTASGVIFSAQNEPVFYLAGDTIWFEKVAQAIEKYQPQIIALNAADAQFTDSGSIIMNEEDIRKVVQAAPKAKIIITHMDAVPHAMLTRQDVKKMVAKYNLSAQILIPEDGEVLSLH